MVSWREVEYWHHESLVLATGEDTALVSKEIPGTERFKERSSHVGPCGRVRPSAGRPVKDTGDDAN